MDSVILIDDVEIFDGTNARTFAGSVLVRNNRIEKIARTTSKPHRARPCGASTERGVF